MKCFNSQYKDGPLTLKLTAENELYSCVHNNWILEDLNVSSIAVHHSFDNDPVAIILVGTVYNAREPTWVGDGSLKVLIKQDKERQLSYKWEP